MASSDAERITQKVGGTDSRNVDSLKSKWWTLGDDQLHSSVFEVVNGMRENQSYRSLQNEKFERLYGNYEMLGVSSRLSERSGQDRFSINRVTLNVVKSACDTLAAKISSKKPRPLFQSTNGDFKLKRRAKNLTQYVSGVFEACGVYEVGQEVFLDSSVLGTGLLHVFIDSDNQEIGVERVFVDEIYVDSQEAMYGKPRQIHRVKYISKDVLIDMFPDFEAEINGATVGTGAQNADVKTSADDVMVIESWHLPSSKKAKDGKRSICIDNATLLSEKYTKNYFPFVKMVRTKRFGFWGTGLAEELAGIQFEINSVLKTIAAAHRLVAVPRVFVDTASNVNTAQITNEVGGVIKYNGGTPPVFQTATGMNAESYQYLESLYKKAYEISGISQLSASSVKPPGIDSAVALREYSDQATERWLLVGQTYDNFYLEIARMIVDLSRDLYEDNPGLSVKANDVFAIKGKKFLGQIDWKDCDLDDDKYTLGLFNTNSLPSTIAGKLQMVTELSQAGLMTKEWAISLLDYPDVDRFMSLQTAAMDDIEMLIELMLEEGIAQTPEPYMDLNLAVKMCLSAYLRAKTMKGVKEANLQLLRTFIDECQDALNPPPTAPPAQGAPPGQPGAQGAPNGDMSGQPIAQGAPPPVSQLLPIQGVPQA